MHRLILLFILPWLFYSEGTAQPFPYINIHHNSENLSNCIIITQKVNPKDSLFPSLKEIIGITNFSLHDIDTFLSQFNYHTDSIVLGSFGKDIHDTIYTTVDRYYKRKNKINSSIILRKICFGIDSSLNNCLEKSNFFCSTPLHIFSPNIYAYLLLKKEILSPHLHFNLSNCKLIHLGRKRIWHISELYKSKNYEIEFKLRCKKAIEKEDGFYCKKCTSFEMILSYTQASIEKKLTE